MEPLTIFYSWQSDLPNKTNRGFIQKALETAVQDLNRGDEVLMELAVDRDTQNTHGAKHIADSILEKIQRAAIFVCDVSFINSQSINPEEQEPPRLTPNPNVLIELGYALHVLGYDRILLVFNTAFGKVEDLPFDIRFRRVIRYTSPISDSDRASQRKKLIDDFKSNLPAMLKSVETTRHTNMQELINKATEFHKQRVAYINGGEPYLEVNSTKPFLLLHTVPLELIDSKNNFNVRFEEDREQCEMVHPLKSLARASRVQRDGILNYIDPSPDEKYYEYHRSYSLVFLNGTIEFADIALIYGTYVSDNLQKGFRTPLIDSSLIKGVRRALRFYQSQNMIASVAIFLTLCNAKGLFINEHEGEFDGYPLMTNDPITFIGTTIEDIHTPDVAESALRPALDEVYRCFGYAGSPSYWPNGGLRPQVALASKLY